MFHPGFPSHYRRDFERTHTMKYIVGWLLGIPASLLLIWFILNHL
jgi:hypothetical protein